MSADDDFDLAMTHFFEDRLDEARAALGDAYRGFRDAGNERRAAYCAMHLAELHANSFDNRAVAQGWLGRARRLLERAGPCVEWGWFELALVACDRPDVIDLERSADRALQIAEEYGDNDLEVRALADGGLALVSQGRLVEGFARLDEAMAAILAADVQDLTVLGLSFCAMLTSCERAGDVARAEEWMRVVAAQMLDPMQGRPRVLQTHCRLAFGSVLTSAGRWQEAEVALLDAIGPNASRSSGHRVDATARLAELRIHQGRLEEAAELLAPYEHALSSALPLARVHLLRGDAGTAVATAQRALRELVGDVSRRAPLLAIVVEAELTRADLDAAEASARELAGVAADRGTSALRMEAALSSARVAIARGHHPEAIAALRGPSRAEHDAWPLLGANACLLLAGSLAEIGDVEAAVVEARAALTVFEQLGAVAAADQARALLRRLGAHPVRTTSRHERLTALSTREAEVLTLLGAGLTNSEIAARLYISAKTAEHHVGRILTKLGVRSRAEAAAVAAVANIGSADAPTAGG